MPRFKLLFIRSVLLLLVAVVIPPAASAYALETVTLQLKWTHAFQFAGYYAAQEKGFYREAGLNVRFLEAGPGIDPVESVLTGKAEFGVGTSNLLLARKAGKPVVVLAVVFQHSPLVLMARSTRPGATLDIRDLAGKRIMIEPQSDELIAYLKQEGVNPQKLIQIPHSFQPNDLIEGRVDAMSAYVSNEPYFLDKARFTYQTFTPRTAGIDFYGDNLFTTEKQLQTKPERVRAFREASLRGWQYAMEHPEEIATLLAERYPQRHSRDFYLYEAKHMAALLRTDLIEVGYMNRGRWRHIADTYADLGLLPRGYSLDGFLYEPNKSVDLTKLTIALVLLAAVSAFAAYVYRINRRLTEALAASKNAEEQVRHLALHDPLTQLPNRALFADRLRQAQIKAKRNSRALAVMFVDLDNFKAVNDSLGHECGDQLLCQVAEQMRELLRESDTVARLGGDEFAVLLPSINAAQDVRAVAEKILAACTQTLSSPSGEQLIVTCSIGIAIYPEHGESERELLHAADEAMYRAKHAGRNAIMVAESLDLSSERSLVRLLWRTDYQCGNAAIDQEHRLLFSLANSLLDQFAQPQLHMQSVTTTLDRLQQHVLTHFQNEEALLKDKGYPDLDEHCRQHAKLIDQWQTLRAQLDSEGATLGEIIEYLAIKMVQEHLIEQDRKYFDLMISAADRQSLCLPE